MHIHTFHSYTCTFIGNFMQYSKQILVKPALESMLVFVLNTYDNNTGDTHLIWTIHRIERWWWCRDTEFCFSVFLYHFIVCSKQNEVYTFNRIQSMWLFQLLFLSHTHLIVILWSCRIRLEYTFHYQLMYFIRDVGVWLTISNKQIIVLQFIL